MMLKRFCFVTLAGAGVWLVFAALSTPVYAASISDNFMVEIEVQNSCTLTAKATNVDFGSVTDLSSVTQKTSTLKIKCNPLATADIALTPGNGNTAGAGVMTYQGPGSSSDTISYQLYRDSAGTKVWGNQVGTNTVSITGDTDPAGKLVTIYVNMTGTGVKAAGHYSDQVTISITY